MKSKTTVIVMIAAALSLVLIGGFLVFARLFSFFPFGGLYDSKGDLKKNVTVKQLQSIKAEHGELLSVSYSRGGGMEGDTYLVELKKDDAGALTLKRSSSASHVFPVQVREYSVSDPDALTKLREYIDRYNLAVWSDLPFDEEHIALDAPTTSIGLAFDDSAFGGWKQQSFRISYDNVVPEGGYDILNGLSSLLHSFIREEDLSEMYILGDDGEKIYTGSGVENSDDEIRLLLCGYWRSEKLLITGSDGSAEETPYTDDDYVFFDLGSYSDDLSIELISVGGEGERTALDFKELVHERLFDYDSSWYAVFEAPDGERCRVTVAGDRLYMELQPPADQSDGRAAIVFYRKG